MLEPSHKEPCEGVPPGSSLARLQRLLLVHALRLRDDVEASIRRCAAGSTHLKPQDLKTALWRVDSEIPEPRVDEYITLVYGEDYYDPPHKLGEFQTMAVEEVCARLFAEPFVKRWSPRTHEGMREGIIANLKAVDKGKKGKGGGGKEEKGRRGGGADGRYEQATGGDSEGGHVSRHEGAGRDGFRREECD